MKNTLKPSNSIENPIINIVNYSDKTLDILNGNEEYLPFMTVLLKAIRPKIGSNIIYTNPIYKNSKSLKANLNKYASFFIIQNEGRNSFFNYNFFKIGKKGINNIKQIDITQLKEMNEHDFFELFNSKYELPKLTKEIKLLVENKGLWNDFVFYNSIYLYN